MTQIRGINRAIFSRILQEQRARLNWAQIVAAVLAIVWVVACFMGYCSVAK